VERIKVTYWEKWNGFEGDGMRAIVREFNNSQDRVEVVYVSTSTIDQKTLIATAGGRPPDIAGLWDQNVFVFADKGALTPLDDLIKKAGISPKDYIPAFWNMCTYAGRTWALPSTPATTALQWNKEMFRKAGLNPDRAPRTIAELDAYSKKLVRIDKATGTIRQMGFLPTEPGWWHHGWGYMFGGKLWDGGAKITMDDPKNIQAFEWIQSYAKNYGPSALQTFRSTFGNFATAQDSFLSGKVAMVLQGVWLSNYIEQLAPGMEWGAAPFPTLHAGDAPLTFVQSDMLVIPRGAKHPAEAFEFIRYVNRQGPMERLCLSHRKISPLRNISPSFYRKHRNPYIRVFQELAWSKNAIPVSKMAIWNEYGLEIANAVDRVWLMQATPKEALGYVQARIQKSWDRERARQAAKPSRLLSWSPVIAVVALILAFLAYAMSRTGWKWKSAVRGATPGNSLAKGLLFASPWLIGLSIFTLYPVMASIIYSFCDYSVLTAPRWLGLQNYTELARDGVFWISLRNTLVYAVFALPLGLIISIVAAILLDSGVRGSGIYRTMFFLPTVTPLVASAIVWLWIFNSQYGMLNYVISFVSFGLIRPIPWLTDASFAMPALIMMSFWGIGYTVVILLAAIQEVPASLYEAADLDGASWWHKVIHITLPLISPVIYFNMLMGIIGALQVFAQPYIMTQGGPARATLFYSMYLYNNAFQFLRMGYASAMAWILFIIILALTLLSQKLSKSHVFYASR
jgi:ABC-type sugar transport system permease subunit/ABC-type glycerol-3-phosphate transport system substrate-binding protein